MSLTVFDLSGIDRLAEWKKFRDHLEYSKDPFQETIDLWNRAPFVNPYLDPSNPSSWPDPWKLILDNKLDDLAISLGIFYTLSLTSRFIDENIEIHMSMPKDDSSIKYPILVGDKVLNWSYGMVNDIDILKNINSSVIYKNKNKINKYQLKDKK